MASGKRPTTFVLSPKAIEDLQFWARNNPDMLVRITKLTDAIMADPYSGIGKPKALRYSLEGCWSRRIDSEHRYIYEIVEGEIQIIALRGHYV